MKKKPFFPHLQFGTYGINVYFTYALPDFQRFVRWAGLRGDSADWKGERLAGRCIYKQDKQDKWFILIQLNGRDLRKRGVEYFINTVVHECSHALDDVWDYIGETAPGSEVQAYTLGAMVELGLSSCPTWLRLAWYDAPHGVEQRKRGLKGQSRRAGRKVK